jgi:multiple sugar transport system substrate-binding protein
MKNKILTPIVVILGLTLMLAACAPAATTAPTTVPTTAATTAPTTAATMAPTTAPTTAATAAVTPTAVTTQSGSIGTCPLSNLEPNATITFSGWGDQTEQQIYRDSIKRFEQVCQGVTVNYNPIPTDFQTKMKAQMAGGTAPDVFYVDFQLMSAFAPSGQLLALDPYMQEAGVSASDYISADMSEFTYNGTVYGLPKDWGTLGLIYLPEAFQAAGIPEPTSNWTWTDLMNAAATIHQKTKYAGFCQAPDVARFAPWVFSNGGSYTTPDFKTPTLDTPQVTQMATLISNMYKAKDLVQPSDVGASWCGEAIGKQLAAMTLEGGWMVSFMKGTYPDVVYKAVEIPSGPVTRADYVFTNALGVNASTKYPRASAALALYITGEANLGIIQSTGFAYSTHPDQLKNLTNPIDVAISAGGLLPASHPEYWGPYTGQLEAAISKALESVYLGQQTVDQAFAQLQSQATTILQNGQ